MEESGTPSVPVQPDRKRLVFGAALIVLLALGLSVGVGKRFGFVGAPYEEVYALVQDKISQSAAIVIHLPKGLPQQGADKLITFEPPFTGEFVTAGNLQNALAFVPAKPLEVGKRYTAKLALAEGVIAKDFVIDEDPKVLEVFPRAESEASEHSAITIMFNRPMVPLTTLGELEKKDVAVSITPQTEGKFKWISTRTLQFIPKERLAYSAHYSVKILPGFSSTDGVPVPSEEFKFITHPLRHEGTTEGTILYNQPIDVRFNVPIDLARTSAGAALRNVKTGAPVAFDAEYGTRYEYDDNGKPKRIVVDRSVLSVYPKTDRHGRARVWDFGGEYIFTLAGAYPVDGDIAFQDRIETRVSVTEALQSFTVSSERTPLASPELFDPEGSVAVGFYEPIDLMKTEIAVKGLKNVSYAKKCRDVTGVPLWQRGGEGCEKEDDKTKVILTFERNAFARGESVPVTFKKVMNAEGLVVTTEPLTQTLRVYPELKVLRTVPPEGEHAARLTELTLCTNVPLLSKDREHFKNALSADGYLVFNRWEDAYRRQADSQGYSSSLPCNENEYVNTIRYGLHPEKNYQLSLSLTDVFGGTLSRVLAFRTGTPPEFYTRIHNLQKIYNVTTPDKTTFTYAAENLPFVNLFLCKVAPATLLSYLYQRPEASASDNSLNCLSTQTATIDLADVYWVNNYFQVDLKKYFSDVRGQYIISLSAPSYRGQYGERVPLYERTYISVTDIALGEKKTQWTKYDSESEATKRSLDSSGSPANLYWVANARTLASVSGARVQLYTESGGYGEGIAAGPVGVTGTDGVATFALTKDIIGAVVETGSDAAIISSWTDNLAWAGSTYGAHRDYVYTDRPIYRPGQEVHIKGISRFHVDGRYEIAKGKTVRVSVKNPKDEETLGVVVPLSEFGTFVARLALPPEAALGTYRIDIDGNYSPFFFEVAEYQGAAFEVQASAEKDEYTAGEEAKVSVSGTYYFGMPLSGGVLSYQWTAQDYYFDRYTDEYFNFGTGWYTCFSCGYGDRYLGGGETALDEQGTARVTEAFDFGKLFKDESLRRSKIIVLHGTVKDLNGKSVSFQKSFIVHRGDFYLGAKADPSFAPKNEPITVRVKTVDTKGAPVSQGGIKLTASRVSFESAKRQEVDGGFYSQYERVLTPVLTRNLGTNGKGDADISLSFKDAGEYAIALLSSDRRGNVVTAEASVYIYGEGVASVEPQNNETLDIVAEKRDFSVGEKAKFIIKSPYPQAKALVSVERGRIFTYEIVTIDRNFYEYEVPITDEYVPNVYVSVLLLAPEPAVKFGQVELRVNASHKALTIDVTTDKKSYLPGEKVTLHVATTDYAKRPVAAEVSVAVADLSILALKGNPKKDPLVFFYNGLPLTVTTASNIKNILEEREVPTGTKGGDGGNPTDLARRKRGEFKDTAFWEGRVVTGADGKASVTFTLPDNLTRWQIESVGITQDTKVGADYREITAAKSVMAVPLAPRFILPGDAFSIGVQVFNQTEETQPLSVTFESPTLTLSGPAKKSLTLKAGESATLSFPVLAPQMQEKGSHIFTVAARNGNYEDTVERSIPIKRNDTYESVATEGIGGTSAAEYVFIPDGVLADRGEVRVRVHPTPAFFLADAVSYLAQFPYGCSEQLASKLSMLAVLKRVSRLPALASLVIPPIEVDGVSYTTDEAIAQGLARLYEAQTVEGGFAYYQGLKADIALSIHVLGTLLDLSESGVAVSPSTISRASEYVATTLVARGGLYYQRNQFETDTLIDAVQTLSRVPARAQSFGVLVGILSERMTPVYLHEKISSGALATLALVVKHEPALSHLEGSVWKALDNRIDIDSRGAYLKSNSGNIRYIAYETPIKNTALLLRAIAERGAEHTQTPNVLRWLFASRDKSGAWGSTNATLSVIDAVTRYLAWSGEGASSFNFSLALNGSEVAKSDVKAGSLKDMLETILPIARFEPEKNHKLAFTRTGGAENARFYYDIDLTYYLPAEKVPPRDEGITLARAFYSLTDSENERPLSEVKVGEVVRGKLRVMTPKPRSLVAVEDFLPAGLELIDFNLATEDEASIKGPERKAVGFEEQAIKALVRVPVVAPLLPAASFTELDSSLPRVYADDAVRKDAIAGLYPDFRELHDDRLFLFIQNLPAGEYVYEYYARATTAGVFQLRPAVASELYFPETFGRTAGSIFTVKQ